LASYPCLLVIVSSTLEDGLAVRLAFSSEESEVQEVVTIINLHNVTLVGEASRQISDIVDDHVVDERILTCYLQRACHVALDGTSNKRRTREVNTIPRTLDHANGFAGIGGRDESVFSWTEGVCGGRVVLHSILLTRCVAVVCDVSVVTERRCAVGGTVHLATLWSD